MKKLFILLIIIATSYLNAWTRTYGGNGDEEGRCVKSTLDGGYIAVGYSNSYGTGEADVMLIKTDSLGAKEWCRYYGSNEAEKGVAVIPVKNGGYVVLAQKFRLGNGAWDAWLFKTDSIGKMLWEKTFGGECNDIVNALGVDTLGNFVAVGHTESYGSGGLDAWAFKTDSRGNLLWEKTFGDSKDDWFNTVYMLGSIPLVAGGTKSYGKGESDMWWLSLHPKTGDVFMEKLWGDKEWDEVYSVIPTSRLLSKIVPGYLFVGVSTSWGVGDENMIAYRTDTTFNYLYRRFIGENNIDDRGYMIKEYPQGYYIVGITNITEDKNSGDLWLVALTSSGSSPWKKTYGGSKRDVGNSIDLVTGTIGGAIITGYTESFGKGGKDLWLLRVDSKGDTLAHAPWKPPDNPPNDTTKAKWTIYPNIGSYINLKYTALAAPLNIEVFDLLGCRVDELTLPKGSGSTMWGANMASGIYFFIPKSQKSPQPLKVVISKDSFSEN